MKMISGGKCYVSSPPAFSNDAKKLLICTGNSVSIFSTSTALQISELEGHTDLVTSVIVVPASSKLLNYCWTSSLDGTIRYWDFSGSELVKAITISLPIHYMVIPGLSSISFESDEKQPDLFAYVSVEVSQGKEKLHNTSCEQIQKCKSSISSESDEKQPDQPDPISCISVDESQGKKKLPKTLCGQIRKCNLTKSRMVGGVTLAETQKPEFLTSSPAGKYIGIRDKKKLRIWEVPTKDSDRVFHKKIRLHHTKKIATFAFHPTERIVAAGDATGRILIWRGFGDKAFSVCDESANEDFMNIDDGRAGVRGDDDADSCTTWHWHSAEVKVLFFSSDGAYLYSGGKEGVLMVWQLDTEKRKFLPRIGSPLLYYTSCSDPSISAISCADNRIHILKLPSMEILKSISGIKLPRSVPEVFEGLCNGIAFDQTSGVAAIRTENYCIQFYSLLDDREISEVQVCERNHQPVDEVTVTISVVALSPDGCVMCTVETRLPEDGIGGLVSLKFWVRESQSTNFSLSTIVYEPHRDTSISEIAFHPTRHMAVSSSYGGDFKVWVSKNVVQKDQARPSNGWTCHAVGSYKKKPMTAAAFSADGSILAVAAETVITIWNPEKNVLVAVIGESLEPISRIAFIGKSDYLVSASGGSKPQLSVWSLSKMSMLWSYKLHAEAITSTMGDSFFAVLGLFPESSDESTLHGVDGVILLFKAEDPIPVTTWFARKARGGGLAFVHLNPRSIEDNGSDNTPASELLAFINNDHEYVVFSPHGEQLDEHGISLRENRVVPEETGPLGYESIYGELADFKPMKNSKSPASVPSGRPWETIFSGSSHNLPSFTKLCSVFLESLLEKRTTDIE